ncbi:hypothetical protein EBU24_00150 [bacterium]|nr:hypothetical protein [bacterium]
MKNKKFIIDEVKEFYIKANSHLQTVESIAEKVGAKVEDIQELYNTSKVKASNSFQVYSGTVSMTEKQAVSDDISASKDNVNHEFLDKYKNTRHKI